MQCPGQGQGEDQRRGRGCYRPARRAGYGNMPNRNCFQRQRTTLACGLFSSLLQHPVCAWQWNRREKSRVAFRRLHSLCVAFFFPGLEASRAARGLPSGLSCSPSPQRHSNPNPHVLDLCESKLPKEIVFCACLSFRASDGAANLALLWPSYESLPVAPKKLVFFSGAEWLPSFEVVVCANTL